MQLRVKHRKDVNKCKNIMFTQTFTKYRHVPLRITHVRYRCTESSTTCGSALIRNSFRYFNKKILPYVGTTFLVLDGFITGVIVGRHSWSARIHSNTWGT